MSSELSTFFETPSFAGVNKENLLFICTKELIDNAVNACKNEEVETPAKISVEINSPSKNILENSFIETPTLVVTVRHSRCSLTEKIVDDLLNLKLILIFCLKFGDKQKENLIFNFNMDDENMVLFSLTAESFEKKLTFAEEVKIIPSISSWWNFSVEISVPFEDSFDPQILTYLKGVAWLNPKISLSLQSSDLTWETTPDPPISFKLEPLSILAEATSTASFDNGIVEIDLFLFGPSKSQLTMEALQKEGTPSSAALYIFRAQNSLPIPNQEGSAASCLITNVIRRLLSRQTRDNYGFWLPPLPKNTIVAEGVGSLFVETAFEDAFPLFVLHEAVASWTDLLCVVKVDTGGRELDLFGSFAKTFLREPCVALSRAIGAAFHAALAALKSNVGVGSCELLGTTELRFLRAERVYAPALAAATAWLVESSPSLVTQLSGFTVDSKNNQLQSSVEFLIKKRLESERKSSLDKRKQSASDPLPRELRKRKRAEATADASARVDLPPELLPDFGQ